MLAEFYPARTARSNKRQNAFIFDALDKFRCLFHNGQICGNVHVKDFVGSQSADRIDHFTFYVGSDRQIKAFAQCGFNRRGCEKDDLFGWVCNCVPYLVDITFFIQCSNRAGYDALSAADTRRIVETALKGRTDVAFISALYDTDD